MHLVITYPVLRLTYRFERPSCPLMQLFLVLGFVLEDAKDSL